MMFYTGKGDHGETTRLGGARRISKSERVIEAVGALDEAMCAIGMARAVVQHARLREILPSVQQHLVQIMSHVSATPEARTRYVGLDAADVQWLESLIVALGQDLPPLHEFVLPGDSVAGAACHQARVSVRRAERRVVALMAEEAGIAMFLLAYMNRLSSLLFVAALQEDRLAEALVTGV